MHLIEWRTVLMLIVAATAGCQRIRLIARLLPEDNWRTSTIWWSEAPVFLEGPKWHRD